MQTNRIEIPLNGKWIPSNIFGVDIGQTLIKIAHRKEDSLILISCSTKTEFETLEKRFIHILENGNKIILTGGKAFQLFTRLQGKGDVILLREFQANAMGSHYMLNFQPDSFFKGQIIVSIGTGTSIVSFIPQENKANHLGGTALGGGFFMGFVKSFFLINDYKEALNCANSGNRFNVDLKVSDIYEAQDPRINRVFREATAASLGKLKEIPQKEDLIQSILWMIGENIATIACAFAEQSDLDVVIFMGGFLKKNKLLKRALKMVCRYNKKKAVFMKYPEFVGAFGALYYKP
ncbi:MAG: hypothetical protein ACTSR8_17745 [Promethearchaeota archaeon]